MRARPLGLPLIALAVLALMTLATTYGLPTPPLVDFKPEYCGGLALRLGLDPYRIGSLRLCEATPHFLPPAFPPDIVFPADLPTFALAFDALFSFLPYDLAAIAFLACGIVAVAFVARDLRTLTGLGWVPIGLALAIGTLWLFTFVGHHVVFMSFGLLRAAVALERGRPRTAALWAALMMAQPHVGIAVLLSLFVAEPPARRTVAGIAAALAGVLALQPGRTYEYLHDVLPYAALVHASNFSNLGTAWMLHGLGLSPELSVRIGGPIALLGVVAGAFASRYAARRYGMPALAILLAPAFALLFGIYAHVQQASFVLPAALVLWVRSRPPARTAFVAVVCLSIPWMTTSQSWRFAAPLLLVTLGLARTLAMGKRMEIATYLATIAVLAAGWLGIGYHGIPPGALAHVHATDPRALAQANVDAANRFESIGRPAVLWILKAPTWIGYIAVILAALRGAPAEAASAGRDCGPYTSATGVAASGRAGRTAIV